MLAHVCSRLDSFMDGADEGDAARRSKPCKSVRSADVRWPCSCPNSDGLFTAWKYQKFLHMTLCIRFKHTFYFINWQTWIFVRLFISLVDLPYHHDLTQWTHQGRGKNEKIIASNREQLCLLGNKMPGSAWTAIGYITSTVTVRLKAS